MRKILLPVTLLLVGAVHAQKIAEAQVPAAAKATFKAKFPTVKNPAWEKEGAAYEVGFKLSGKTMSAVITPDGQLRETETDMAPAELPAAVRATLARDYKAHKVNEAARITRVDGTTVFEAEVAKGGRVRDILFTAGGKVVPK